MHKRLPRWLNGERLRLGLWIGIVIAVLLVVATTFNLFVGARLRSTDLYFVPTQASGSIVIVALDDESMAAYGRSPLEWRRSLYADLIDIVTAGGGRVIAFDLLFIEPTDDDALFAEAIQRARASETRTRVVLAAAGLGVPIRGDGRLIYADLLHPAPLLAEAADYLGYVDAFPDADGTVRRQPSLIDAAGVDSLSFSLATYLAYLRIPAAAAGQVISRDGDRLYVTPERALPVDDLGFWTQNYFGLPSIENRETMRIVSIRAVLEGEVDPAIFADKIVLVGSTATGSTDRYPTPISPSEQMAGVEVQANAIDTLILNQALRAQSTPVTALLIVGLALLASLIYTRLRWYWIVPVAFGLTLLWLGAVFVNFSFRRELIDLFSTLLALLLPAATTVAVNISIEASRRRRSEFLLQSVAKVADQQLALENILPPLADDIRQILSAPAGVIALVDAPDSLRTAYRWGSGDLTALEQICQRGLGERDVWSEDGQVGSVMRWQGRVLAVAAAQLPPGRSATPAALSLLSDLTQRIAPALENAALYSEISRQKSLLEAILLGSPAAVFVLDSDLRVWMHNTELDTALGQPVVRGTLLDDLIDTTIIRETTRDELRQHFHQRQAFSQQIQIGRKTFSLNAALLEGYGQWVVILSDVTALVELNELKTRMIRMASHDLKNPLARVIGYAEFMLELDTEEHDLSAQQRRFVESIASGGKLMQEIITGILNLEQLRSGSLKQDKVDLVPVVRAVCAQSIAEAELNEQTLQVTLTDDALCLIGDAAQLGQMAANLISNALRYSPPKQGAIQVRLYRVDTSARLEVEDNGYGIPEQSQAKLFTEFYRVRTKETAHIEGTGLGLSLVKSVVEAHGGRIWFKSQEGVGTTFYVQLPILDNVS